MTTSEDIHRATNSYRPCPKPDCEACGPARVVMARLQADARALWAVAVLDTVLLQLGRVTSWDTTLMGTGYYWTTFRDGSGDTIDGPWDAGALVESTTPRDARLVAAQGAFPDLPEAVRRELGECP